MSSAACRSPVMISASLVSPSACSAYKADTVAAESAPDCESISTTGPMATAQPRVSWSPSMPLRLGNWRQVAWDRKIPPLLPPMAARSYRIGVDFDIPAELASYLTELDDFIEREIRPLEQADDNIRFFDYRREDARTDWDRGGLPNRQWEELLREAVRRADAAGHYRYAFPAQYGGKDGTNLGMAVIREHLASKGLGLHCDLQNEHMIVGNNVGLLLMIHYGSDEQRAEWVSELAAGRRGFAFGITEPAHGSDATFMETTAVRDGQEWVINGEKTWNTGMHAASHDLIFARTSGGPGDAGGITAFLTPSDTPGLRIEDYLWTFNMPTDHAHVTFENMRVPDAAIFGGLGRGLQVVQHFFNENRIRQAASSLGAAQYCICESVAYAKERKPFGVPLAE